MKKLMMFIMVAMLSWTVMAGEIKKVELKGNNFFPITTEFTEILLEDFIKKTISYKGKELYVYIDSPGGSVLAMSRMIGIMESSPIKFICVARFAASAAFNVFQYCDKRYMLYDGILMSHNASGTFSGELPRIDSLLKSFKLLVQRVERGVARKLKLEYKDYKALINKNFWLVYPQALEYNATDGIASITCSGELLRKLVKKTMEICSIFGCKKRTLIFSACPLIKDAIKGEDYAK